MKCKILRTNMKGKKAEPVINEFLAENSNMNIKFITETIVNGIRRICFYYE